MTKQQHYSELLSGASPAGIETKVVPMGDLVLPSGRLYCCDPFLSFQLRPFEAELQPGSYVVRLVLAKMPDWGYRVGLAALVLSEAIITEWVQAAYPFEGRDSFFYQVDSGLACFMDATTEQLFDSRFRHFYDEHPEANFYDDILRKEFARNAISGLTRPEGDWLLYRPDPDLPLNIAIFASGLGDGHYACFFGLDEEAQVSTVITDFGLF